MPQRDANFGIGALAAAVTTPAKDTLAIYGASDCAVTANGGDYTVHGVIGVDPDGNMYVLDLCENKPPQTSGLRLSATW